MKIYLIVEMESCFIIFDGNLERKSGVLGSFEKLTGSVRNQASTDKKFLDGGFKGVDFTATNQALQLFHSEIHNHD